MIPLKNVMLIYNMSNCGYYTINVLHLYKIRGILKAKVKKKVL